MKNKKIKEFEKLIKIMEILRGKNGCPWDKKQTHRTIIPYLLEEAYELIEAFNRNDREEIKEELGDLLLQVIFHCQIAKEKGNFDIYDVIKNLNEKLIKRHPHVFTDKKGFKNDWDVRAFWEKEKKIEKKRASILDGIPVALPSLLRARRLVSKAKSAGFYWRTQRSIIKKIKEELGEVICALKKKDKKALKEEIGDLLFVIATFAYYNAIDPEYALHNANDKFIKRFKKIEKKIKIDLNEKEILKLWSQTKT